MERDAHTPPDLERAILAALGECDPDAFISVPVNGHPVAIDGHFDMKRVGELVAEKLLAAKF